MNLSAYKALLFDFDRTLTNSQKQITPATQEALQRIATKGFITGLCTGRHFTTLRMHLSSLFPPTAVHITAGGGQLIRSNGEVIRQHLIDEAVVQAIARIADELSCRVVLQDGERIYGNASAIDHQQAYYLKSAHPLQMQELSTLTQWSLPLVTVGGISDTFIERIRSLPISFKDMSNYYGERYIDITAYGVTKASAIGEWCTMHATTVEKVIGFGDSENDEEFLATVGYAIAVGNAVQKIKELADEVIDDADDDGVAHWIHSHIPNS